MTIQDLLHNRLLAARRWTETLLSDVDPGRWFEPPAPGVQHLAWQVGHLAVSQAVLVHGRCLGNSVESIVPSGWSALFARGSKPTAGPNGYPPHSEVRAFFDRMNREALDAIRAIDPQDLDAPTHGDPHPMFTRKGECLAMVSQHETFHAGQIALTRRIFGLPPLR